MVAYAWAGFGGVFGPAVILTLYCKNLNWKSVLTGMMVATITIITWKALGYGNYLYEIVPTFILNVVSVFVAQKVFFPVRKKSVVKNI